MYCHRCGAKQDGPARFCSRCGVALAESAAVASPPASAAISTPREVQLRIPRAALNTGQLRERGRWRAVSGSGGLLLLVAFFLPWVTASCDASGLGLGSSQNLPSVHYSGFELAVGPRIQSVFGSQQLAGSVILWLIPAAAFAVMACALFVKNHRLAAGAALAAALVSLLPMFATWQSFESQRNAFTRISIEIGLWLALLGVAISAIGGFVGLSAAPEQLPLTTYDRRPLDRAESDEGLTLRT